MLLTYENLRNALPGAQEYENYFLAKCVWHSDNHPSMLVYKDGIWRCLGCGRWGGWVTLWNKLKGQPVIVHPEKKVAWAGPDIRDVSLEDMCYQANIDLMSFSSFQWYIIERGLENRIEVNEIGYYEGWYTFPVYDREHNFVTAVFRAAPHVQKVSGERYRTYHSPVPYVPDWNLLDEHKIIFVVFGIMDALTLAELRLPVMTSTSGLNFNPHWLDPYRKVVVVLPDKGEEVAGIELQKALGWRGHMTRLDYPINKKDPNGFFEANRKDDLYTQLVNLM